MRCSAWEPLAGRQRRRHGRVGERRGHGLSRGECQWHPKEGAGSEGTVSEVREEHVPGSCPPALPGRGAAAERGAAGGRVAAEVDYQLCGGERPGERALRCVTGLGGSLHSVCSCNTSVTSHSAVVRITTHPQQLKQAARSAVVARPGVGAAKPNLHASPSTRMWKHHGDPPPAASLAREAFQVPLGARQGLHPAAGSVSYEWLCEGRNGGMRRLSIPQVLADTQGRLICCPDPPPAAAG